MSRSTESIRFDSAAEFLAALRRSNPRWLRPKASLVPWVFRGHRMLHSSPFHTVEELRDLLLQREP